METGNPLVAYGKVYYSSDMSNLRIHCLPIKEGNMKVEVVEAVLPESPIPEPTFEAYTVSDAVNSFVQWPRNLIFLKKQVKSLLFMV